MKKIAIATMVAAVALGATACGSDKPSDKDVQKAVDKALASSFAEANESQGAAIDALPNCADITAAGQPVDAKAVDGKGEEDGVCKGAEGEAMGLFWTNDCKDGRVFVYSKENSAMGFDGDVWKKATETEIDDAQMDCIL